MLDAAAAVARAEGGLFARVDLVTLGPVAGAARSPSTPAAAWSPCFLALIVVLFAIRPPAPIALLLGGAWVLLVAATATFALAWPPLVWKYASYRVGPAGIEIRRGVVIREVVTVPRSRVQHTDVSQGPIERQFGLATLILHTAGTHHAAVPLEGLAHETALRIRDHFVAASLDDAV